MEVVSIVGVRVTRTSNKVDFYFFYLCNTEEAADAENVPDTPVVDNEGLIIAFTSLERASDAWRLGREDLQRYGSPPSRAAGVVDVAHVFALLDSEDCNENHPIWDMTNLLLDCVQATNLDVPPHLHRRVKAFDGYLIEYETYHDFEDSTGTSIEEVKEGLNWMLGALLSKMRWV
jgi:hypothetical protein